MSGLGLRAKYADLLSTADPVVAPLVYPAAWLLRLIRATGVERMPSCKRALLRTGVFPIRNHYYEPQFDLRSMRRPPAPREAVARNRLERR